MLYVYIIILVTKTAFKIPIRRNKYFYLFVSPNRETGLRKNPDCALWAIKSLTDQREAVWRPTSNDYGKSGERIWNKTVVTGCSVWNKLETYQKYIQSWKSFHSRHRK